MVRLKTEKGHCVIYRLLTQAAQQSLFIVLAIYLFIYLLTSHSNTLTQLITKKSFFHETDVRLEF